MFTPTATDLPEIVRLLPAGAGEAIQDGYIVVYKSSDAEDTMAADIDEIGALGASVNHVYTSSFDGFSAYLPADALKKLRQSENIDFIEPDMVVSINDDINIGINSIQNGAVWGLDRIDQTSLPLDSNYSYYQSGAGVHAYIIDTGIYAAHPDFGGRASQDADFTDGGPSDCNGHGTHVAGTVGSSTYGVAKDVTLHGVRVLNCSGSGSTSSILAGIDWVKANHIKPAVANMSLGGYGQSSAEKLAIDSAVAAGVTFVVAAGNDTYDACEFSPAFIPSAITVGSTTSTDEASSFSNYGSCLDIYAPGSSIISTSNSGGTATKNGTSMASPHVAGAAALILQSNPSASPATVAATLINNSTKNVVIGTSGSPNRLLYTNPVMLANPGTPVLVSPKTGSTTSNQRPVLTWKLTASANTYTVEIATDYGFSSIIKTNTGTDLSYTPDSDLGTGVYYWRVKAINTDTTSIAGPWSSVFSFTVDITPPDVPVLSLPLEGATPVGIPSFTWLAVTGANAYQFEFDDNSDFASPVFSSPDGSISSQPVIATLTYKPTGMLTETLYYWRVRARDAMGNWGDWSLSRSLIVQASVPAAPAIVSPVIASSVNANPTLKWNSVTGGVVYQVQVSSTNNFSGTLLDDQTKSVGEFSHTISAALTEGIWYWRVRAFNSTQGAGAWSAVANFIYDITDPDAPVLSAPLDGSTPLGTPSFTWLASTTAKKYQFEYGTSLDGGTTIDPIFTSPDGSVVSQPAITVLTYKPSVAMLAGTTFYWHVKACDAAGNWGDWSAARSIIVQAVLPIAPVLKSPATSLITNTLPVLEWNSVTNGVAYQVQLSNFSTFTGSPIVYDAGASLSYTLSTPFSDGVWYWRVRAINISSGAGPWSAAKVFTYDTLLPAAPVLKLPTADFIVRTKPAFTWNVVVGANAYQFEFGTSTNGTMATFSELYTSPILTTVTHTPPALSVGVYYWHVKARDIAGNWGDWGELRKLNFNSPILCGSHINDSGYWFSNKQFAHLFLDKFQWGCILLVPTG